MRNMWPNHQRIRPSWEIGCVALATAAGLVLRLYGLGDAPLSALEVYTWDFSHQTVPFIFETLAHIETNPPLYYLIIKLVTTLNDSEFILRLPSALAGTLAIALTYLLGRLGGVRLSGLIGAGLVALGGLDIYYSQLARAYALAEVACLLASIGIVIIIGDFADRTRSQAIRREAVGWVLFTSASIVGFYLHYTFAIAILVLECAIAIAWAAGRRFDRTFLLRWSFSSLGLVLGMSWGLALAVGQAHSDNIGWIQVPSLRDAAHVLALVDGYTRFYRFQPWPNLLLMVVACVGLVAGWKRSAAIFVSGLLFALFPLLLFLISQYRPVFIERVLFPSSFAACILVGHGCVFFLQKLNQYGERASRRGISIFGRPTMKRSIAGVVVVALFFPALVSVKNRGAPTGEPYDSVAEYLAAAVRPGDAAAGTDGVIYYRQKIGGTFPYFKISEGNAAEAQITYGAPVVHTDEVRRLADIHNYIYLVLRESIGLLVDGRAYSYSTYIRNKLGHAEPPIASFGTLGVYRLSGVCPASAPCLEGAQDRTRGSSTTIVLPSQ